MNVDQSMNNHVCCNEVCKYRLWKTSLFRLFLLPLCEGWGAYVGSLFCDVVSSCFFLFSNHHAEEERTSCFSLCLGYMCSVSLPQ